MKLVINIPDYIKEQADDGKGKEFGIPLWLAYEIANGTPLPKGHGRIIDESKITKCYMPINQLDVRGIRTDAQTIIEADKGEGEG